MFSQILRKASIIGLLLITACSDKEAPVGKMPAVLKVGEVAPEIIFESLMGADKKGGKLSDYRGNIIYLDFWASWCKPCLTSMPLLNELRSQLKTDGFEVLAINLDNDPDNGRNFLLKYPVDYPAVYNNDLDIYKRYKLNVLPTSYIIDKQGVVRYAHQGFKEADIDKIRQKVMLLLNNKSTQLEN